MALFEEKKKYYGSFQPIKKIFCPKLPNIMSLSAGSDQLPDLCSIHIGLKVFAFFASPSLLFYQWKLMDILAKKFGFNVKVFPTRFSGYNYLEGGTWDQVKESGQHVGLNSHLTFEPFHRL